MFQRMSICPYKSRPVGTNDTQATVDRDQFCDINHTLLQEIVPGFEHNPCLRELSVDHPPPDENRTVMKDEGLLMFYGPLSFATNVDDMFSGTP